MLLASAHSRAEPWNMCSVAGLLPRPGTGTRKGLDVIGLLHDMHITLYSSSSVISNSPLASNDTMLRMAYRIYSKYNQAHALSVVVLVCQGQAPVVVGYHLHASP
jgi:hypothetical protein